MPEGYKISRSGSSGSDETVLIPKRLKLYWVQEGLELDVVFRDVKINEPIKQSTREALFVEPTLAKGFARINLAERRPATAASSPTTIRETRPAPPSGVRLRQPTALDGSEAARTTSPTPLALSGEEPMVPSLTAGVIGAALPRRRRARLPQARATPAPAGVRRSIPGSYLSRHHVRGWTSGSGRLP